MVIIVIYKEEGADCSHIGSLSYCVYLGNDSVYVLFRRSLWKVYSTNFVRTSNRIQWNATVKMELNPCSPLHTRNSCVYISFHL